MTFQAPHSPTRLFLLSFLLLFVELTLIRWLGANIVYLSYFSNFVLLGSFLGIGVGFLRSKASTDLFPWAPIALTLLILFVHFSPVEIAQSNNEILYFGKFARSGFPIWITLPIIFIATAIIMAMLAEDVARTFSQFEPLLAYRLNLLGSIAGVLAFSLLSFFDASPIFWGIIIASLLLWLSKKPWNILQLLTCILLVLAFSNNSETYWSPYYKLTLQPKAHGVTVIAANGVPHQQIESTQQRRQYEPFYFLPYQHRPAKLGSLKNVLIIGAGTGSDVAIALKFGAQHIDAVEIDPLLYHFGKLLHPDRPYTDPRVHVIINDGRAFLERSSKKYDLIIFALPDSLTLVSGQSSLRLESYLFTREALRSARDHLTPNGVFTMYNYYRQQWLIDRLANTLQQIYHHSPCIDANTQQQQGLAVLTIGLKPNNLICARHWPSAARVFPAPATDNHPFLYLRDNSIPIFYGITLALIMLTSLLMVRVASGPLRNIKNYLDLGFMGAAFLLLETKNIVGFALLFGTTWFVNALVFVGILLVVLAAVETARYKHFTNSKLLYGLLFLALAIAWLIPTNLLLTLPLLWRFIAAITLAFAPIFLANLIFAERFRQTANSTIAFGVNLLGAMVGGLLEYAALIVGYRALLIVTAVLYGLAFILQKQHAKLTVYSTTTP
jgi:hypothetical protein